jgi:arabinofuranan 3-O-arabinosyltransferase
VTSAGHDRPQLSLGRWHAFELGGSPPTGTVNLPATMPLLRIARPAAGEAPPRRGIMSDRWWFLIVFLVALTIFCGTDTGRIFFDTKLGVDIDAREFLVRLWSLWNPLEWFGSLQDQYIGYAIPMAPFFLAGQLLHVPIWLIERLWLSLLLAFGFTGLVKLARALNIGSDNSRLLAGAVFALWPTFTILIGSTSAAALPGLVVPWAVLPLISAVQGRSTPGRAAARSGLAVAAMGGVNAVCTIAVLVLPALYILTHTRSRQRVLLSLKWGAAVCAATAWWAIPLLLQGRYSFNFLPYIEQSATTTRTLSAAAVLRGTGTWTAYFNLGGTPWLSAGWAMVTSPAAILASAAVAAVGLAGLARRDMPERRWLCIGTAVVALVALAGYYGPLGGPWHTAVDNLLDGPLAPFRSLYKIEPVIAVALALGCAHTMDRVWRLSLPLGRVRLAASAAAAPAVALTLAGLAFPQLTGQGLQAGSFTAVPRYWYQTAAYLAAHSPRETALVVPANPHGQFTWGDTIDNPLEPLATSPWVERGLVPYGGAGSQELLETAEQAVESGQQVPGLASYLARAGIRYIVVRNDTATIVSGYTPPQVVNETLARSGFRRVAAFGPQVAAAPGYPNLVGLAPGFAPSYPAVEIFEAADSQLRPASPVTALPVSQTVLVNGGPDSLLQLDAQGILGNRPAVIAGQHLTGTPALWAVTDGQRRADNEFGSTDDYQSYTYTASGSNPVDDPLGGGDGPPRQLLPVSAAGHQTVAVLTGAASVTASSAGTWINEAPQYNPDNAFDGNPATAWAESSPTSPVGQWIQINFDHAIDLPSSVGIQLLDDSSSRAMADDLRVTTATGSAISYPVSTGDTQPLLVPPGRTRWLRITILDARDVVPGGPGAGITDVLIPGVRVTSYLQPAEDRTAGARAPAVAYSFAQQVASVYDQDSADSVTVGQRLYRTFVTPTSSTLTVQMNAVPTAGSALAALLTRLTPADKSSFLVTASSSWDSLPEFGPDSMYEPGARLPWISAAGDPHPELEFSWHGRRTIRKIVLHGAYGVASAPTGVLVGGQDAYRLESVGLGGIVRISPPLRTDRLYLSFPGVSSTAAGNTAAGQPSRLPVGLAKVTISGLSGLHPATLRPSAPFRLSCGHGPSVSVSGRTYQTSVSGTVGDLIQLNPVQLHLCSPGGAVMLPAGQQWLATGASADFTVTGMSLSSQSSSTAQPALGPPAASRSLDILTWGSDNRTVRIGPGAAAYAEIHENVDAGWTATLNGRPLTAATLDGWQQAFIVPAGRGGTITLTFRPATIYHAGLVASVLLLLLLLGFSIGTGWLRRRRSAPANTGRAHQAQQRPSDIRLPPSHPALVFQAMAEPGAAGYPPARTPAAGPGPSAGYGPSVGHGPPAGRSGRHRHTRPARTDLVPGNPAAAVRLLLTRAEIARTVALLLPLAIVIGVAGGPIAIAVPVLAMIGWWRPRWLPGIAFGAMLAAGVLVATSRVPTALGSGPFSGAAQACALVALAAALLPAVAATRPTRPN